MRWALLILSIIAFNYSADARIRLYSRDRAEQWVADSLIRVDSLRVDDSIRVADSMLVARYRTADIEIKGEKAINEKEMERYKPVDVDSSQIIIPEDVDHISSKTIEIDESNHYYAIVDSIQSMIDSINNTLHDTDLYFIKMKSLHISEKKRYLNYLMENHFKDSSAVRTYCNQLYQLYTCRLDMLIAIRNSQTNNSRSLMAGPIEEQRLRTGELSNYLLVISPKIPFSPVMLNHDTLVTE